MRTAFILTLSLFLASTAVAQIDGAVICTNYTSAAYMSSISLEAPWPIEQDLEPVYHDAVANWYDGLLYVVNRAGADNIQVLDPSQDFQTIRQFSLGLGRNLQDIAFLPDGTAYVSCYDTAELLHVDPQTGAILHIVSTAAFADADGLPETSWLCIVDGRVFVTCQRLDRANWYSPVGDSYVLVLDAATRTWVDADPTVPGTQGVATAATNPYTRLRLENDRLLVGCNGFYGMQDGGVDVIDLASLTSLGLEMSEATLGGDIVDFLVGPDGHRWTIVADAVFVTHVKTYTVGGNVVTVHSGTGYDHAGFAFDGDFQLFVADRRIGAAGVRVFDAESGAQLTSGPLATGLPPAAIVLPAAVGTPAPDLPLALLTLAAPWPNPANPATTVAFSAPPSSTVTLRIIDLRGRLVRRRPVTVGADGLGTWQFDGCDNAGRTLPSGVYRCVAESGGLFAARSLTIVR